MGSWMCELNTHTGFVASCKYKTTNDKNVLASVKRLCRTDRAMLWGLEKTVFL